MATKPEVIRKLKMRRQKERRKKFNTWIIYRNADGDCSCTTKDKKKKEKKMNPKKVLYSEPPCEIYRVIVGDATKTRFSYQLDSYLGDVRKSLTKQSKEFAARFSNDQLSQEVTEILELDKKNKTFTPEIPKYKLEFFEYENDPTHENAILYEGGGVCHFHGLSGFASSKQATEFLTQGQICKFKAKEFPPDVGIVFVPTDSKREKRSAPKAPDGMRPDVTTMNDSHLLFVPLAPMLLEKFIALVDNPENWDSNWKK